jgi:hypothetical protein
MCYKVSLGDQLCQRVVTQYVRTWLTPQEDFTVCTWLTPQEDFTVFRCYKSFKSYKVTYIFHDHCIVSPSVN